MKWITAILLMSLCSCSGHFGWGTHTLTIDADDFEIKKEKANG